MRPYISYVVAARNDDYGVGFLHRMQVFVTTLATLWEKYDCEAELIIVEWNPPPDKPRLKDVLTWLPKMGRCIVRILEVSPEVHNQLPNPGNMPMFEYIAKNAGIRRANGEFILATNPDLLFSDEFVDFLTKKRLSIQSYYRADRYDFNGPIPAHLSAKDALCFAKMHTYMVNIRQTETRGSHVKIGRLARWYGILTGNWPGSHDPYRQSGRLNSVMSLNDRNGVYDGIYTNASGDFLMASAVSWQQIRGYPELYDSFIYLDSYGCHQLKALGLEQCLLIPPCMVLHMDHSRHEQKSRPRLLSDRKSNELKLIRDGLLGPALNDEGWGLINYNLPEIIITNSR